MFKRFIELLRSLVTRLGTADQDGGQRDTGEPPADVDGDAGDGRAGGDTDGERDAPATGDAPEPDRKSVV